MTTAGSWEDKAVPRKPHCSRRDGNNDHPPFSQHICTRLSGYRFHSINNMIYFWPGETTKKNNQEKFGEKYYPVLKPPHLTCRLPFPVPPSQYQQHGPCHLQDMKLVTHFQRTGQMTVTVGQPSWSPVLLAAELTQVHVLLLICWTSPCHSTWLQVGWSWFFSFRVPDIMLCPGYRKKTRSIKHWCFSC